MIQCLYPRFCEETWASDGNIRSLCKKMWSYYLTLSFSWILSGCMLRSRQCGDFPTSYPLERCLFCSVTHGIAITCLEGISVLRIRFLAFRKPTRSSQASAYLSHSLFAGESVSSGGLSGTSRQQTCSSPPTSESPTSAFSDYAAFWGSRITLCYSWRDLTPVSWVSDNSLGRCASQRHQTSKIFSLEGNLEKQKKFSGTGI